jgi:hypothetical protein
MGFIPRPGRKFKGPNKFYFKFVTPEGSVERVMLDDQANDDWDNIEKVEVGPVHYDASMVEGDEVGHPTGPAFDRWEIVDYVTFGRQDKLDEVADNREARKRKLMGETVITDKQQALARAAD